MGDVLEVRALTKRFSDRIALDGLSMRVPPPTLAELLLAAVGREAR